MVKIERLFAISIIATILITTLGASFTVSADSVACVYVSILKEGTDKPIIDADVLGEDTHNHEEFIGVYLPEYKFYLLEPIPLKDDINREIEVRATINYETKKETIEVSAYDGIDVYWVNFSFKVNRNKNVIFSAFELFFKIYNGFPILVEMLQLQIFNKIPIYIF